MDLIWLGALLNEFGGIPCQCLVCGHGFYCNVEFDENVVETDEGMLPVCPNCGAVGQVKVL
jgi:hypothetical protein